MFSSNNAIHLQNGDNTFLPNTEHHLQKHMATQPRRPQSTYTCPNSDFIVSNEAELMRTDRRTKLTKVNNYKP